LQGRLGPGGVIPGEAAAVLLLERPEAAAARGARVLARVLEARVIREEAAEGEPADEATRDDGALGAIGAAAGIVRLALAAAALADGGGRVEVSASSGGGFHASVVVTGPMG